MFGAQLASLGSLCTGIWDGAKNMYHQIVDHPLDTLSEVADGIPVVGHIKGIVHLAMGDKEAAIHSEESASRTLVVLGAAALTGASGGVAAPVLAGVVGGILADGVLTGVESARKGHYDPQGMIDISTNVVRHVQEGKMEGLGTDIFDGVVLAAGDGMVGAASSVKGAAKVGRTTTVIRVEGRSLVREGNGSQLAHFRAGDNQRIFHYNGVIAPRERLPALSDPESLRTGHLPAEPTIPEQPGKTGRGGKPRGGIDPSMEDFFLKAYAKDFFDDHGKMIFLNFGEKDRMYGYYAQKLIDHRELVGKYRELFEREKGRSSTVTERTHQIRVKSFEVLTRDLEDIEKDAVTENRRRSSEYRGVLAVDTQSPRQYGLESSRYTPIFNKMIPGSFQQSQLWIRHLPTSVLKLITKKPVAFGKVRRFKYLHVAGAAGATHAIVPIKDLPNLPDVGPVGYDDVVPQALVHCRHVKTIRPATQAEEAHASEHYEYLVKFDKDSPPEWYPEQLVAPDLQRGFYNRAMASAKPVSTVKRSLNGNENLLVERPDGSWEEIHSHQIFWHEQESGATPLGLRELDAVMYHLYQEGPNHGPRVRLHTSGQVPNADIVHAPPCKERTGEPVYLASALNFRGGVHPCKVVPRLGPAALCRVPYGGEEIYHDGEYDLLPFLPEVMEFVDADQGKPPPSRRPILGGYENGKKLYHAIAQIDEVWVPGKAGPQFNGAFIPYGDKEHWSGSCKIL